jgi:hypothetical protein
MQDNSLVELYLLEKNSQDVAASKFRLAYKTPTDYCFIKSVAIKFEILFLLSF